MVHLSQEDKLQKVAWGIQPQFSHAIDNVAMVGQGVKKADKLSKTPLCEHIPRENTFKFLKPTEVFNKRENYCLKVDPDFDYPIKPPHLNGLLGSFNMTAAFSVPAACLNASKELAKRATKYSAIANVMFSSIVHSLAPEGERTPLMKERIVIASKASMTAITASIAVASNLQLIHRNVVLDHLLLNRFTVSWAHTAPFMGTPVGATAQWFLQRNDEAHGAAGDAWGPVR